MNYYLGIDVGKKGSCCLYCKDNKEIKFFDWNEKISTKEYLNNISLELKNKNILLCVIEKVHAMPKQGVTSMFSFGTNYGIWQGYLIGMNIPFILIPPKSWQKYFNIASVKGDTKILARNIVNNLFPNADIFTKRGKYLDGRGDALLMAIYAMNFNL